MKNMFLIISLFLVACQKPPYQDPELKKVANRILYEGTKRGKFYSIEWIGLRYANLSIKNEGKVIGLCRVSSKESTVYIDHTFWMYRESYREQLMAHELGHCLLGKQHDDRIMYENIPKSVMSTYIIDSSIYEYYRTYYFDQLFN